MDTTDSIKEKGLYPDEKSFLEFCGKNGIFSHYEFGFHECWSADFVLAALPALLALQRFDLARQHLQNLARRQGRTGRMPEWYIGDYPAWFWKKMANTKVSQLKTKASLFPPGNTETLFIIGLHEYARLAEDLDFLAKYKTVLHKAVVFMEKKWFLEGSGLVKSRTSQTPKLLDNILLYRAYCLLGEGQKSYARKAEWLRDNINDRFWCGYYQTAIESKELDLLSSTLAVLFGVAPHDLYESLGEGLSEVEIKLDSPNLGFVILALKKIGGKAEIRAQELFHDWQTATQQKGGLAYMAENALMLFCQKTLEGVFPDDRQGNSGGKKG